MKFTFWLLKTFFILKFSNAFSFGNTFSFLLPQKTQSFNLKLVSDDLDNLESTNKLSNQNLDNLDKISTNKLKWPNARFMRTFLRNNANVNNSKNPTHLILGYNELPKRDLEIPSKKDDNAVDWNKILNDLNQATDFKTNLEENNFIKKNVSKIDKKEEDETMNNFFNYWSTFFSSGMKENVTIHEKEKTKKKIENTSYFYLNNNNLAKKLIEVIICDKTLAIIDVKYSNSKNRIVKDCALFDLEKREKEANEIVKKMNLNKITVNFVTMMDIINQCKPFSQPINSILDLESSQNLSLSALKIKKTLNPKSISQNQTISNNSSYNFETSGYSFVTTGIVTGTLWCGVGDLAKSYYDLGPKKQLDICCRAHDHCPIRLKGFHHGYGLFNFGISTKSHCQCDKDFHDCLKSINDNLSNTIGNIYFNSLKNKCIDEYCYPSEKDGKLECVKDGSMFFSQPEPF